MFICPVCRAPLSRREGSFTCPANHCYDLSKEGYLYLLPPNKKHSHDPGDTREMVAARRAFLDTGGYALFREELVRLAGGLGLQDGNCLLDVGCGEGYYTAALHAALPGARVMGVDIAKCAVRAAAKRYKGISFAVASCFDLPVPDASVDLAVNVFAPIVPGELGRVLRPGGALLLAVPGPEHLYGLKEMAYEEPYLNELKDTVYEGFTLSGRTEVTGELRLRDNESIRNLFAMTPYYWKTSPEGSARVRGARQLDTPISFHFLHYTRNG